MTLEEKTINILVGKNIKKLRKQRSTSGQNLAQQLGISYYKLRAIENGVVPISLYLLLFISNIFEVEINYLFRS